MRFGSWARFGLRFGGGRTTARALYDAALDARGTAFSRDPSTDANLEEKALAMARARASRALERAANQGSVVVTTQPEQWEQRLGVTPLPTDMPHQRRATLGAVVRGANALTYDGIVDALTTGLGTLLQGATPSLIMPAVTVPTVVPYGVGSLVGSVTRTPLAGRGGLIAGVHYTSYAMLSADGTTVAVFNNLDSVTIGSTGSSLLVGPDSQPALDLTNGAKFLVFMSVAPGSTSLALAGVSTGYDAVEIATYPTSSSLPGPEHYGVVLPSSIAGDATTRSRVDAILGPMLPAWCTYDVIAGSPFILGTATPPASALGTGAL